MIFSEHDIPIVNDVMKTQMLVQCEKKMPKHNVQVSIHPLARVPALKTI